MTKQAENTIEKHKKGGGMKLNSFEQQALELPEIEIVIFEQSDVIRTSPGLGEEDDLEGLSNPDFFVTD